MTVKSVILYEVECDEPGCGFNTSDYDGAYVAWDTPDEAVENWIDADQQAIDNPDGPQLHYCENHKRSTP